MLYDSYGLSALQWCHKILSGW